MTDDSELIKAGTEGLVEGTLKSFHDLILRLFGPAADEAGLILKDYVKYYRARQKRFFKVTQQKFDEAHIEPQPVPLKILKPIIENASIEDSDELQDVWAALLVSVADPATRNSEALLSYISVLKELSSNDVRFLNAWFDTFNNFRPEDFIPSRAAMTDRRFTLAELLPTFHNVVHVSYQSIGSSHIDITVEALAAMLAVLVRHSLVAKVVDDDTIIRTRPGPISADDPTAYTLTDFGVMFIAACRGSQTVA